MPSPLAWISYDVQLRFPGFPCTVRCIIFCSWLSVLKTQFHEIVGLATPVWRIHLVCPTPLFLPVACDLYSLLAFCPMMKQ